MNVNSFYFPPLHYYLFEFNNIKIINSSNNTASFPNQFSLVRFLPSYLFNSQTLY